jgi:hypothetical protein
MMFQRGPLLQGCPQDFLDSVIMPQDPKCAVALFFHSVQSAGSGPIEDPSKKEMGVFSWLK